MRPLYPNWHEDIGSNPMRCGFESHLGHAVPASEFHTRVIFKPETIIPDIDLETSGSEN